MNKPQGYDDVAVTGDFTPIELGGHKLVILGVKEVNLKGYEAITVQIDMAKDDKQPNYYQNAFKEDTRDNKKYQGNINIFTGTSEYNGKKQNKLKAFLTAVENSNEGFKVQWGENFCNSLKGKAVGGVFGEAEYEANDGTIKTSRKLRYFRKTDGVFDAEVPAKKEIAKPDNSFMNIPDGVEDEGLPFN